jgi:hypothetical protein
MLQVFHESWSLSNNQDIPEVVRFDGGNYVGSSICEAAHEATPIVHEFIQGCSDSRLV